MEKKTAFKVGGKNVPVSNLEKIYYPKPGFTKGEMIAYYIKIAPLLLPHLKGRPLTFKRYPNGVDAPFFYEKECPKPTPTFVKTCQVARHHESGSIQYCLVNNLPTLVWAANLGDLEMHTFLSRAPNVHQPTSIVFDLDPGPPATAAECAQVALWLKEMSDNLGLKAFIKSSGSKGLQVYIPLNTPVTYAETSPFAKAVAQTLEHAHPRVGRVRHEEEIAARQSTRRLEPKLRNQNHRQRLFSSGEGSPVRLHAVGMVGSGKLSAKKRCHACFL